MPWTPTHPAFTIPFLRFFERPFTVACLVIGSIAPDLPYFFFVRFVGWGHEFPTNFLFGIPITLIVAFIWVRFLRPTLFNSLPIKTRLSEYPVITKHDLVLGCIAATIGIMTHLFTDAFTHVDGYAVGAIPQLNHELNIFGHLFPFWHLLQYCLSAFGEAAILYSLLCSPHWSIAKSWRMTSNAKKFWSLSTIFALMIELFILLFRWPLSHITGAAVSGMTAGAAGMVIASFIQTLLAPLEISVK